MEIKEQIEFSEFLKIEKKLDIRLGLIINAERIPKSDKLLKLTVKFSENDVDNKIVVTNIGEFISPESLLVEPTILPFIMNLKPSKMMGVISEAMIMVGTGIMGNIQIGLDNFGIGTKLL